MMSLGIKQYVVLAFACNLFLVAVKAWDVLQPASCQEALATWKSGMKPQERS